MATEKRNLLSGNFSKKNACLFAVAVLVTIVIWNLPITCFGIDGLTVIQQRIIAVFALATILWVTEAISPWATSVSLIGLLLLTTSDNAFHIFRSGIDKSELLDHSALMATFADPIIILFLGGFVLAIAATKSGLDVLLARTLLKPFGNKSENVLLGFILITGVFSMFVSNTATAAMMLTFLAPVFKALPPEGKGRVALTLSIPVAANIGGMGTPIGTPPNAIALKYLNAPTGLNMGIGFGQWMMYMLPLTILLLFIGWFLLKKFFPFKKKTIELEIEGEVQHNWRTAVVAVTFIITVLLWICDRWTGVGSNTVAMVPIVVFAFTGVIKARDLEEINWSVIWMVAGGFALGLALNDSGLADNVIKSIRTVVAVGYTARFGSDLLCTLQLHIQHRHSSPPRSYPRRCLQGYGQRTGQHRRYGDCACGHRRGCVCGNDSAYLYSSKRHRTLHWSCEAERDDEDWSYHGCHRTRARLHPALLPWKGTCVVKTPTNAIYTY